MDVQPLRQPRHRAALRVQLLPDEMPDVDKVWHDVCGFRRSLLIGTWAFQNTKKVDISYPHSEVLRKPMLKDKSVHD